MDLCTASVPIGLFFGRIANFINGELFGRPTTMPWGMVFPEARLHYPTVEPTPRHPSQLYEAALEGLVLFLVLRLLTHRYGALKHPGIVTGTFLVGYAIARSISEEFFRQPHFAPRLERRRAHGRHDLLDPDADRRPRDYLSGAHANADMRSDAARRGAHRAHQARGPAEHRRVHARLPARS